MTTSGYTHYRAWKGWNDQSFGVCSTEQAIYYGEELKRSGIDGIDGKTVLEIGFGNGEFAAWVRSAGADYHGTELIPELVAQAAAAGFKAHDGGLPLENLLGEQSVDLIVAFDVFEHLDLETLLATLRSAHLALRPAGRMIVRVPSGDSPFSRAIQHGDTTHRIAIGSSMARQLGGDAGFVVDGVREPAFPLRGLGLRVFLRRMLVSLVRTAAFAVISRALMGGGRPVLTPNMVFVFVKP